MSNIPDRTLLTVKFTLSNRYNFQEDGRTVHSQEFRLKAPPGYTAEKYISLHSSFLKKAKAWKQGGELPDAIHFTTPSSFQVLTEGTAPA